MEATQSPEKARAPARSRKSIAHMPSPEVNIDKENVTIDSVAQLRSVTQAKPTSRKPRSKSIGPGGLDTLKEDAGNRRQSAVAPFMKSILKRTMRLSSPKQIPPHSSSRRTSPRSSSRTTPEKTQKFSLSDASIWKISNPVSGSYGLPNPFEGPADPNTSLSPSQSETKVAVRTEAEQQAAAKERERQENLAHKDARRKSLANRRVSFAPEATLHTWDVVEIPADSTTSSASDNSTRRASALSAVAASPYPQLGSPLPSSDASEPPSTPPEQLEEIQVTASPAQQRDLHQKKQRRSLGIPPMNFNNPDDFSSSVVSVNSDDTESQAFIIADEEGESSNSDDEGLVEGENTITGINGGEITTQSNEGSSTGSSGKLEEALRQAAKQAGTQGIDHDENGDITMEMADDEITAAFKPWMKKGKYVPRIVGDPSALQDQENVNPFSPAFKANLSESVRGDDSERTMEFTQAVGEILPHREQIQASPKGSRRNTRRSSGVSRRSSGDGSVLSDETMDLTTAIGGIHQNQPLHQRVEAMKDSESVDEDEELTMEFTSVVGGVLERRNKDQGQNSSLIDDHIVSRHLSHSYNESDMDITTAQGGILPSITECTEPAKGLLGKRPAELDEDDDENLTPKRLKGREGSPVKKVRLPAPPSKVETIGRMTRSGRLSLADSTSNYNVCTPSRGPSPLIKSLVTTPKDQLRFKDAECRPSAVKLTVPFNQKLDAEKVAAVAPAEQDDRIHLQDFLNMTSIRFMELTTTKRRLTVAPSVILKSSANKPDEGAVFASSAGKDSELENCVVAGACTVPMLELYQHSCRELKKYIAEGRSIVREIEADTFEDNPPLFREYISAPPDIKSIMDNQFKNVKTHARLLSKAMWYEWRMKLLDGLKDGLLRVGEGLDEDDKLLAQQQRILDSVLPGLVQEHDRLGADRQMLQAQADELASCDQEELQHARDNLIAVEKDVQTKQQMVEDLQRELRQQEEGFENAVERNQQCLEEIKKAEKIRQEYRGWSPSEVAALQAIADALEKAHGWTIISATGTSLTMTYKRTLQLFFTPASFLQRVPPTSQTTKPENAPISLTYIADADEYRPQVLTTEKRFFLQIMRAQLQCIHQSRMRIKDLLRLVSHNWEKSCAVAEEVNLLGTSFITEPMIQSDEIMTVRSMLLLRDMRTKIETGFKVTVRIRETTAELDVTIWPIAKVVYGEGLKEKRMVEFLEQKIGGKSDRGSWARSVRELKERLIARGRK